MTSPTAEPTIADRRPSRRLSPRSLASLALKIAVSGGLIWLIVRNTDVTGIGDRLATPELAPILSAFAVLGLQIVIISLRFDLILRALDRAIGFGTSAAINLIGIFFNQSLPSTIGGDVMRVWRLTRRGLALGPAVSGVLLDRATALLAMLILIAILLVPLADLIADPTPVVGLGVAVGVGLVGAVAVTLLKRLPQGARRLRLARGLESLVTDYVRLLKQPRIAIGVLGLAIVNHVGSVSAVYLIAQAYGVGLSFTACLLLVPPVLLLSVLPVSIAGWGVREVAMITALGFVGIAAADALVVSIAFGVLNIAIGLPGGLLFLLTNGAREQD